MNKAKKISFTQYQSLKSASKKGNQNSNQKSNQKNNLIINNNIETKSQINYNGNKKNIKNQQNQQYQTNTNNVKHTQDKQQKYYDNSMKINNFPQQNLIPIVNTNKKTTKHQQQQLSNNGRKAQKAQNLSSLKKQQISKLDLIFQQQPQQVQKKLRKLLLNYNAIMQYNSNQDKFQVDLLLPFGSQDEKFTFIQQFMKQRNYIKKNNNQEKSKIMKQQEVFQYQQKNQKLNKKIKEKNNYYQKQNKIQRDQQIITNQNINHKLKEHKFNSENIKNKSQNYQHYKEQESQNIQVADEKPQPGIILKNQNILSDSMIEQNNIKDQQINQNSQKIIDFNAINISLEASLSRAFHRIKSGNLSRVQQNQLKQIQLIKGQSSILFQNDNKTEDKFEQVQLNLQQSKISSGFIPNSPNSFEINSAFHSPHRFQKTIKQTSWVKPIQQPIQEEQNYPNATESQKQTENEQFLYDSPVSHSKKKKQIYRSNKSSNQILIQDQNEFVQQQVQQENHKQNLHIDQKQYQSTPKNNSSSYRSVDNSQSYNSSSFDMIQQTNEQHQEENHPSIKNPKQFQEFLKKKMNIATQGLKSPGNFVPQLQSLPNPGKFVPHLPTKFVQQPQPNTFMKKPQTQQFYNSISSSYCSSASSSAVQKKYADFLKSNHSQLERIYETIGKQIRKNNKKKEQLQKSLKSNKNQSQYSSQKQSKSEANQILVLDSQQQSKQSSSLQKPLSLVSNKTQTKQLQQYALQQYKKRISIQNQSMSSQDKVRYFKYLSKHAKDLYINYIRSPSGIKKVN